MTADRPMATLALAAHCAAHPMSNQHDDFLAGWNAALARLTAEQAKDAEIGRLRARVAELENAIKDLRSRASAYLAYSSWPGGGDDTILNKSAQTTASENPHHG